MIRQPVATTGTGIKPAFWVGMAIIVAALAFGSRAFITNLTPYVSFEQARGAKGNVQTMGKLDKTSIRYDRGTLDFNLVDDAGQRLPVTFSGPRAANFEEAIQITAIGRYDGKVFQAKNLLVKCPTKYQGTETKEYSQAAGKAKNDAPAYPKAGLESVGKQTK